MAILSPTPFDSLFVHKCFPETVRKAFQDSPRLLMRVPGASIRKPAVGSSPEQSTAVWGLAPRSTSAAWGGRDASGFGEPSQKAEPEGGDEQRLPETGPCSASRVP